VNLLKLVGTVLKLVNGNKGNSSSHQSSNPFGNSQSQGHSSGTGKEAMAMKLLQKFLGKK
jgi:hypothetical protein